MVTDDTDDIRALPRDDAVHYVILRRVEQLEKAHNELDRWRTRADIMLDNVAHLETRFTSELQKQTTEILGELKSVKTELSLVVKDKTFWANSRTIARWVIGVSIPVVLAAWAVFTFVYEHMHVGAK